MNTNPQTTNINDYLEYAKAIERIEPIVAVYCRLYYVDKFVQMKKSSNMQFDPKTESVHINNLINQIQQAQKASNLTKDQKQIRVSDYCKKMFDKIMVELHKPDFDERQIAGQLKTMIDFIEILTIFGPLSPEWVSNRIL